MKPLPKIVLIIAVIIVVAFAVFFLLKTANKNPAEISDEQIIALLKTNSDSLKYIENHPDFKIDKKVLLTKSSILDGQAGENFKEVYQDLEPIDSRYLRVDLINGQGDSGLITVLDIQNNTVLKAYALILLKIGQ